MNESKSLEKNVNRIVKAFEVKGFTNIRLQMLPGLYSEYTRIYTDLRPDLSVVMYAGGEGDNIAFGAEVLVGRGDFPSVDYPYRADGSPMRGGEPETIIDLVLNRHG